MPSILLVNPSYERLVRRHGLDRFDRVMRWHNGRRMVSHASRDVTQIELAEADQTVRLFVKREWQTYLKDRVIGWLTGLGWGTKARHEWRVLETLRRAGVGCAEPVAMAERGAARRRGYLILRAIPGAVELGGYLAERRHSMTVPARRELAAHLAREVARLHEAGVDHPDLYGKHILLSEAGREPTEGRGSSVLGQGPDAGRGSKAADRRPDAGPFSAGSGPTSLIARPAPRSTLDPRPLPSVWFIDLQRSSAGRPVSASQRMRDLAALDATLPRALAGATDRLAFLNEYLRHVPQPIAIKSAAAAVRQRSLQLARRRKIRETHGDQRRSGGRYVQVDGEVMYAAAEWLAALRRARLDRFGAVLASSAGQLLRRLPDRDNVLLELPGSSGPVRAYLKRHRGWYPLLWLRQRLFGRRVQLPGTYEAAQINRLERTGVCTMELIAFGQRFRRWGRGESFSITREVAGAVPLDDLLQAEFAGRSHTRRDELRRLIRRIAEIVRRFHDAGYNHQDLYCCHFLVRRTQGSGHRSPGAPGFRVQQSRAGSQESGVRGQESVSCRPCPREGLARDAEFDVHLIDLQRVQYRRCCRDRWVVKDLAQLNYSAPPEVISCTDRLRFLRTYLKVDRLGGRERRLIRRIAAKTARIARHDARKRGKPR